jgi:murein DD-endopeptidase MepM/ murein hydrolase activator NlpD
MDASCVRRRMIALGSWLAGLVLVLMALPAQAAVAAAVLPTQAIPVATVPVAEPVVVYQPPVGGPVVDGWRPPSGPYGAGNRGVDFATQPGAAVVAPAGGSVMFAGPVAGFRWVVVRHADGRRSSLGPMASVDVRVGQSVDGGQRIGSAEGTNLHWGVREADVYINPVSLLPNGTRGTLRLTR